MTSKQWQLVNGPVAWAALAFGTVHVLIMGVPGWSEQIGWPGNVPPITLTATGFPLFVMGLQCVQVTLTVVNGRLFSKQAPAPRATSATCPTSSLKLSVLRLVRLTLRKNEAAPVKL
jgi:hypothetical protein